MKAAWRRLAFFERPSPPFRRVEVVPPSQRDEGFWALMAAGVVVLGVIYTIAFQVYGSGGGVAPADRVLPFQVLFRDLPGPEQRVFRAMQEGLTEAMATRAASRSWPSVDDLAAGGVPPFAPDALDKSKLRWERRQQGLVVDYIGIPTAETDDSSFLLLVQEPDPVSGEKLPAKPIVDEEHQVLPDQTLLHVTYWKRSTRPPDSGLIDSPALSGWTQIRVADPFESLEKKP